MSTRSDVRFGPIADSRNDLKFPIHHIGVDKPARRVCKSSRQSTHDGEAAALPQAYRPFIAGNDEVELHGCEAAFARPLKRICTHGARHAASACIGRNDVAAICDMAAAAAVVGAQIISTDDLTAILCDKDL